MKHTEQASGVFRFIPVPLKFYDLSTSARPLLSKENRLAAISLVIYSASFGAFAILVNYYSLDIIKETQIAIIPPPGANCSSMSSVTDNAGFRDIASNGIPAFEMSIKPVAQYATVPSWTFLGLRCPSIPNLITSYKYNTIYFKSHDECLQSMKKAMKFDISAVSYAISGSSVAVDISRVTDFYLRRFYRLPLSLRHL